ncbi:MAG: PepSY domain-containing protein [Inconstantimicrobium porci]|uniref:PepSY domain-containing protein n=1 Tax=Inconstantimicrobium porci TaxID=2652291 RepID=UPI002A91B9CA|nr:PepSY domain-containing protein [Inconstantimicrobium porci]MDY5910464.1 PepSY domain-containing protein [Inconstantimicrobium porci]
MKNKKLFSTLVLASFLATGFIQPLSAKANTINANDILESIKKSSGKEFKMAVQNKNQKSLSGKLSKRKTSNSSEAIKFLDEVKDVLSLKDVNNNFVTNKVIDKNNKLLSTYQFNVHYQAPDIGSYYVYVDMNTGKIVNTESRLKFDGAVTGSGTAENGTERTLNLYQSGNSYEAKDITKDMPGQISTYTANNKQEQPGKLFTSSTKTISDPAVVSAHSYAGVVYDFYKKLFNRNSIDGNGLSLISTVHYAKNYANAF